MRKTCCHAGVSSPLEFLVLSVTSSQVSFKAKNTLRIRRNQRDERTVTLPACFIRLPCWHKQSGESWALSVIPLIPLILARGGQISSNYPSWFVDVELTRGSDKEMFEGRGEEEGGRWAPYACYTHLYCLFCISPLLSSPLLSSPLLPDLCIYIVLCSDSWCCVADCETNHPLNYSGMCSWAMLWLISFPPSLSLALSSLFPFHLSLWTLILSSLLLSVRICFSVFLYSHCFSGTQFNLLATAVCGHAGCYRGT